MPQESDSIFSDARLAVLYDLFEGDRDDLDSYVNIAQEFGATRVLDIGCGTGALAVRLVALGVDVVGLDPAVASIDVARTKPGADRVQWIEGDVSVLPPMAVDLVVMTANVAQVFVEDADWQDVLAAAGASLPTGGHLVFETRDPSQRAWTGWTAGESFQAAHGPDGEWIETWNQVTSVELPLVTFDSAFRFADGSTVVSTSTLRFRSSDEVETDLDRAGFDIVDIRDAPDRPGREFVFVARRR